MSSLFYFTVLLLVFSDVLMDIVNKNYQEVQLKMKIRHSLAKKQIP